MSGFLGEIEADIDWRMHELATIKSLASRYKLNQYDYDFILRYSIPIIYSILEGYVVNSFHLYATELNRLEIDIKNLHSNMVAHSIDMVLDLSSERRKFEKKIKLIEKIEEKLTNKLHISGKVPTKSNVNYETINNILERFNLGVLDISYDLPLGKLLLIRNKIAHGEKSMPVTLEEINESSNLVKNIVYEIFNKIDFGFRNKTYLANK